MMIQHWIIIILFIAILFYYKEESFSLSKKPMYADNSQVGMNPYDNVDYQTPKYFNYPI